MTTYKQPLSQFLVFRDGQPDTEYIGELISQERHQALQEAAHTAISLTMHKSLGLLKTIGTGALNGLDELVQSTR